MNQLRQRFLKSRKKNSSRQRRKLFGEALEGRRLLAADIAVPMDGLNPHHNYIFGTDTNRDYQTTAVDALIVINRLNSASASASGELGSTNEDGVFPDVNNDGLITPIDALNIINTINRGEGELAAVLKLSLDVSQDNQSLLRDTGASTTANPMTTRDFELEVGEKFNLEVRWTHFGNDPFSKPLGAFTVYADILANNKDVFAPVLSETQILTISENLVDARSGNFELSFPGGDTATVSLADVAANGFENALASGVEEAGNFEAGSISVFPSGVRSTREQNEETGVGDPYQFVVRYNGDNEEFQNIPALNVVANFSDAGGQALTIDATTAEIPVYLNNNQADGLNPDAFRYNIDFRSSNLNESALYTSSPSGNYTLTGDGNPDGDDVIFDEVGGFSNNISPGGLPTIVPNPNQYNGQDFEAYSLELVVVQPGDVTFSLNMPDLVGNQLTVFGSDEALTEDGLVEIDLSENGEGLVRGTFVAPPQDITIGADSITAVEDTARTFDPVANDTEINGGTLTLKSTDGFTQPTNGTVTRDGSTNTLTYTPDANYNGPDSFTYTVVNSEGVEATGVVSITVSAVNDPPTAVNDSGTGLTTPETDSLTITAARLLANDLKGPANESSQTLTVTGVSSTSSKGASVSFNSSTSEILYTPLSGELGNDTFTYTISDGAGGTATGTVTVNVTDVNTPPVAVNDTIAVTEDVPLTIDVSDLLANDSDDNNILSIASVTAGLGASAGSVVLNSGAGTITYTPAANVFGSNADSFTYTLTDGVNPGVTATVRVNITGVNDAPVATDDALTVDEGLTPRTLDVLDNDNAGPGEGTSVTITDVTALPAGAGTIAIAGDGQSLIYTAPSANYVNTAIDFSYTIQDSEGLSATADVTLSVVPTVRPRAIPDVVNINEDSGAIDINVLSNDLGNVGESVTLESIDTTGFPAAAGTLAIDDNGTATKTDDVVTFTPAENYFSTSGLTFTYTISDTSGDDSAAAAIGANTATVTINVASVNDKPVFGADGLFQIDEDETFTLPASVLANDSAGPANEQQTLAISAVAATSAAGGTVTLDGGVVTFQPAADYHGNDSFTYTISDGVDTTTATASFSIASINDAPNLQPVTQLTQGSEAITLDRSTLLSGATPGPADESSQTLTIFAVSNGGTTSGGGTVVLNADQSVTYTPVAGFSGTDTFEISVRDNGSPSEFSIATVSITNNAAPVVGNDTVSTYKGLTKTILVSDLLANDSDAEGDTLTITSITQPSVGSATLSADGTTITLTTPSETSAEETSFTYTVTDSFSDRVGTVAVEILPFQPSTISGSVYVDQANGSEPNGSQDDGEVGLGAVWVTLTQEGSAPQSVLSDAYGNFVFENVAPGDYTLSYAPPSGVVDSASNPNSISLSIAPAGGETYADISFTADSFNATAGNTLDRYIGSYLMALQRANPSMTTADLDALAQQGIVFGLDTSGDMTFMYVKGGSGFDSTAAISATLSEDGNQLELTKLYADGRVSEPVIIQRALFISVADPDTGDTVIRVLGNVNFVPSITAEGEADFSDYTQAVDQIFGGL
ncbi:Ig-like domain-containing protein [Rosistilla oblonga]|uniref:Ig-like domain-containing protein n=1 Tax=Rosistilla oblonga TaxID=2527990 RepID=UPI003A96DFE6